MHVPNEFLERLEYFGFATDGDMMIRIKKTLANVFRITPKYLAEQLSAMKWRPEPITPDTLNVAPARFYGQLLRIDFSRTDIELGSFGLTYVFSAEEVPLEVLGDDPEMANAPGVLRWNPSRTLRLSRLRPTVLRWKISQTIAGWQVRQTMPIPSNSWIRLKPQPTKHLKAPRSFRWSLARPVEC
jgi:hypothetical protein